MNEGLVVMHGIDNIVCEEMKQLLCDAFSVDIKVVIASSGMHLHDHSQTDLTFALKKICNITFPLDNWMYRPVFILSKNLAK